MSDSTDPWKSCGFLTWQESVSISVKGKLHQFLQIKLCLQVLRSITAYVEKVV